MKNSSKYISLFLISIIIAGSLSQVSAGSAEGDPAPPEGGSAGGGGGGGAPDIFYYFIPLIFSENHTDGESKVVVWTFQPTIIQTSFSINSAGLNSIRLEEPAKVEFSPSTSPGLTNGSLIITVGPAQVVGIRENQDIVSDTSFSYSILPARMMGFEFIAPFDGYFATFTRSQGAELRTSENDFYVADPLVTTVIPISSGEYVNSSQPIIGAFYSQDETGTAAAMAIPLFLQGKEYIFNSEISADRREEIDVSFLRIFPEVPTELNITYKDGSIRETEIYGETTLLLDENIRGLSALRGRITVSLEKVVSYSYISRRSAVQLIASTEMRSGELFSLFDSFSTSWSVINQGTNLTLIDFNQDYILSQRNVSLYNKFDSFSYGRSFLRQFILANHSLFGIASSPGYLGHPMSPSMSFLPLPLNSRTFYRNVTDVTATWYRFTNLAVKEIEFLPAEPEKFTGQKIRVTFISNGSLPSGNFDFTIQIDDEVVVDESFDFLQINEELVFEFDEFLQFDREKINVLAKIDINDDVTEINEDDNELFKSVEIKDNLRINLTVYLVIVLLVTIIINRIYRRWKKLKAMERSKFDAILEIQEEQEDE